MTKVVAVETVAAAVRVLIVEEDGVSVRSVLVGQKVRLVKAGVSDYDVC